ncbi:MAG: chromosomal replication initiator protein DnaA [Candidatus Omnitrophica bacterium]|nr:chromosomal replication initiator protein DnaA [Candidatus Omnitrophota bacterium]
MSQLLNNSWDDILRCLRNQVSPQSYETWFAPTKQVSSGTDFVVVEVPNAFFKDWLVEHYSDHISNALKVLDKTHINITYQTQPAQDSIKQPAATDQDKRGGFRLFPNPFERNAAQRESCFNPRYTFGSFVIGGCNKFAHAAAFAVAESPAKSYNPLFIYGGVGLGKTHLMQAIGQHTLLKYPKLKITYMSCEKFTNQLISAIQNRSTQKFKDQYRHLDILMVDDIQFLSGKESTQEEFFHTFNALYDSHKQIIISSDRPPKEIPSLENRLVSRFEWGLVTDIQPPDIETRVAILRKKLERSSARVQDDVLLYIAENIKSNIRELEGALIRVIAYASLLGREISISSVKEVLQESENKKISEISIDKIQRVVAEYFVVGANSMRAKKRTKQLAFPRQVAMYLARELTKTPLTEIGGFFGGRDHTTILHACNKVGKEMENNPQFKQIIENLINQIKSGS